MSADRLCAFGLPRYTATAFFPCSAISGVSLRSISSNASSQLASTSSPSRRISGVVQAVGVLVQLLDPVRLRADEAVAEDVLRVAANRHHLPPLGLDLETAGGFAERAGSVVRGHRGTLLRRLAQLDPERARRAHEDAVGVVERRGRPALAAVHLEAARTGSCAARPLAPGSRAARPGRRAPSAVPRRSSRPERSSGSRARPRPARGAPSRRRRRPPRPASSSAPNRPSRPGSSAGKIRMPSPRSRSGPQTTQVGNGWSARPALAAGLHRGGDLVARQRLGHVHEQLGRPALGNERVAVAELDALAVAHHLQRALERRRRCAATPPPPRRPRAAPRARRCSRRSRIRAGR